ncbi:hypothetical protein [Acinetobacter sp.]|uniref:hypothetical protein n=1 Tax=Acinetobacter sp. TaxID=472 RepID=UPI002489F980|nr:hypothetical protein [Acinetobacter sp.]MDI1225225.1 hypothetical protein [Acinetobacter sp.]
MTILQNALDSIALGVEDYELAGTDERRFISCTRNIFAGILLLFKHQLSELSPSDSDEVLIKQKIMPRMEDGELVWIGEGKKTVDVQGIKERFKSLKIETDWIRLDEINRYRNDIEHYHSPVSAGSVQKMVSNSFSVIANFIRDYLQEDPRELLGEDVYDVMKTIEEVYNIDKAFCTDRLKSLTYFNESISEAFLDVKCLKCESELITSTDQDINADSTTYSCRSCNDEFVYKEIVTDLFEKKYALSHRDITNGEEDISCSCPECGGFFLYYEGFCVACGVENNLVCDLCSEKVYPSEAEVFEGRCSYCNYRWEKMMAE